MRELYLVRHAKSDWGTEFLKDIDRPLNERGYGDAYFMSKWFLKNHPLPACIISSPATRALSTALIFARAFEFDMKKFQLAEGVYESSASSLISVVAEQNDNCASLMLFGHNPGITDAFNQMSEDIYIDNVPTCGIVKLVFDAAKWSEIKNRKAAVGFFKFPKDFRNQD